MQRLHAAGLNLTQGWLERAWAVLQHVKEFPALDRTVAFKIVGGQLYILAGSAMDSQAEGSLSKTWLRDFVR